MPNDNTVRENNQQGPKRPPHFGEDPYERTEHDVGGITDYPSVEEEEPYPEESPITSEEIYGQERLPVDIGQVIPRRETLHWAAARWLIQEEHVRVAGMETNRRRLYIRNNDDANSIYVGKGSTDIIGAMFELEPGEHLELWHQAPVWAVCDSGETAYLSVVNEYVPAGD